MNTEKDHAAAAAGITPQILREYHAASRSAGMRLLDDRLLIRVSGDDRVSFLHGMCTADIEGMRAGDIVAALFVTEHAHVIAESFIYSVEDGAFLLETDRRLWPAVRVHLEKFLVADDVEMEELDSPVLLDLEGPRAGELAAAIVQNAETMAPWRWIEAGGIRAANLPRFGGPACTLLVGRESVADVATRLKSHDPALCDLSEATLEIIRVEHGLARIGVDTSEKTLALEARMERAISFSKGCYVGQETIERATARGALKRRLFALRIEGVRMPRTGAAIMLDGKEVGRLGGVVHSPVNGIVGLAILHHSAWTQGASVRIADDKGDLAATVAEPGLSPHASNQGGANAS